MGGYLEWYESFETCAKRSQLVIGPPVESSMPLLRLTQTIDGSHFDAVDIATATPPQEFDLPLADGVVLRSGTTYWKDNTGMVGVNGVISLGDSMEARMEIGTLPAGFRPASDKAGILVSVSGYVVPVSVYPFGVIAIGVDSLPASLTSTEWCRLIVPAFPTAG